MAEDAKTYSAQAEDAADALIAEYGVAPTPETLRIMLALAWLAGAQVELQHTVRRLS
jgi:hypothetical protein